tara:strand:- start:4454 stop:5251 length:798 start_codon:yes stop_codon:yes gene_type:complete
MIIKIIIIILLILTFIHYKHYNKKNNEINIIQINEFDKTIYENSIKLKQPIILFDFLQELRSYNELSFNSLKDINNINILINNKEINFNTFIENIEKNEINEIDYVYYENNNILSYIELPLNEELKLLTSPISIYKSKNLTIAHTDYISPLLYTNFDRNIFLLYEGLLEFYIYKPNDIQNLYFNKKNNIYFISQIENILNKDKNKLEFPNMYNSEYITVRLYKGQTLILPNNYPYTYKVIEPILMINSKSDTIFSSIFNIKNIIA